MTTRLEVFMVALLVLGSTTRLAAGQDSPPPLEPVPAQPSAPPRPARYSLPWQLPSAVAGTSVRSDTSIALQDAAKTTVSFLGGSYKFVPDLAAFARFGLVHNSPDTGLSGTAITNLAVGATWSPKLTDDLRIAPLLAVALPTGQGGGDSPDVATAAAVRSGIYARAAMDNTMFLVNNTSFAVGCSAAYIADGLTIQASVIVLPLIRVKGSAVQKDSFDVNSAYGLHVGYFLIPELSVGAEARYQRFLTTPSAVSLDSARRDQATVAVGLRAHLHLGQSWLRPGVAYSHPIDDPMAAAGYRIVQVDVPFTF
jgi:hypothetical protein